MSDTTIEKAEVLTVFSRYRRVLDLRDCWHDRWVRSKPEKATLPYNRFVEYDNRATELANEITIMLGGAL